MFRLKELREERHLTQEQFGRKFGLSGSTISLYERGQRQPEFDTVLKFSDFFGVTVDYLLGHVNDPFFYLDNKRILKEVNDYGEEDAGTLSIKQPVTESPVDRLTAVVEKLTPEQACFMVKLVEHLLALNPEAYAAARAESQNLWKG